MTKRIELPDGGQYIEVKDVSELRSGDRRAVKAAVPVRMDPETREMSYPGDYNERQKNALAARIITGWNLQWPIPKGDPAILDELTTGQLDALYTGIAEHVDAMNDQADPSAKDTDPTSDSAT